MARAPMTPSGCSSTRITAAARELNPPIEFTIPKTEAQEAVGPLPFLTLKELCAKVDAAGPRKYLIRGIWPSGAYGVHAAEMKAQKTWNAVDMAVSVASGTPWLGADRSELAMEMPVDKT